MIEGVVVTPLSVIETKGGDVLHGLKQSEQGYAGFGEAYFSMIEYGVIKGWKQHKKMVLNLVVPIGMVRFVLYDERKNSSSYEQFQEVTLSRTMNYCRLTVPPMVWFGFQGYDKLANMLLNIANIEHSLDELNHRELDEINFNWGE